MTPHFNRTSLRAILHNSMVSQQTRVTSAEVGDEIGLQGAKCAKGMVRTWSGQPESTVTDRKLRVGSSSDRL